MKTVTGKVVSTKPISLSTAAKHLSRFTSLENTSSNAVRVYLTRASDAFNSLVQFHKDLRGPTSHRKRKASEPLDSDVKIETLFTFDENPHGENIKNEENKGKRKKNREIEVNNEGPFKVEQDGYGVGLESKGKDEKNQKFEGKNEEKEDGVVEKRKKKKKRGKEKLKNEDEVVRMLDEGRDRIQQERMEVDQGIGGVDGAGVKRKDKKKKKKKRRKKNEGEEDGESFGGEKGKKRKSSEVDGGETHESAEKSGKKKRKRRKTERDGEL
ncbi:hypothetical protein ACH5RR_009988 [Cinchona calisaya]|uniref:Uncharacterized protein n=1 Tax=Cinchona calisaya TaxID=153742 RepID=A0ABD3AHK3_9GENT